MINKLDFGYIIEPLEKRFKELSANQIEVYFDILKHFDKEILQPVIYSFVEDAEKFPTPGKIKTACRELVHKQNKDASLHCKVRPSCQKCRHGFVEFQYTVIRHWGKNILRYESRPCALCNTEPNIFPHYTQSNNVIYMASKPIPGTRLWVPDLNNPMLRDDAEPVFKNEDLEEYWLEERAGVVSSMPHDSQTLTKDIREKSDKMFRGYPKPAFDAPLAQPEGGLI